MEELTGVSWRYAIIIMGTAAGIYAAVILLTRLAGKRSFSKISSFDFAMTVAIGSIISTTILSSTVRFIDGLIGLTAVYLLQISIALARQYAPFMQVVDNSPLLLMQRDRMLRDNLRIARLTEADLRSKLREAGIMRLSEVEAVIFETTGDLSVIKGGGDKQVDSWLMKEVRGASGNT